MSGTSADGIDAVLLEVQGDGLKTRFHQVAFVTIPFPNGLRAFLFQNSDPTHARLDDIARLNILLGELFADAAHKVARKAGRRTSEIDLIGSHGQTIVHLPEPHALFGREISATLQIGDPSLIAKRTGVVTVGDFRVADIAVGGGGAPLVPYVDYLLFRSVAKNRALLNIGGIANITVLPRQCTLKEVTAFDTGPGSMVIDAVMNHFFNKPFDRNGEIASRGKILPHLLRWMMRHPYLGKKPPKLTGREMFGEAFVEKLLRKSNRKHKEDVVATVSAFSALAVYDAYIRFIRPRLKLDELLVSGGGVHNQFIMDILTRCFEHVKVLPVEKFGMSSDAKEAICFALLANETLAGNPSNVPGATGARAVTVLGKICLP